MRFLGAYAGTGVIGFGIWANPYMSEGFGGVALAGDGY